MTAAFTPFTPADEVRKARRDAGLDQAELAKLVGVSRKTVSNWETGRGEPTISMWRNIARVTGAAWLLGGEYAVITPTLRLITTTAHQMSDSYGRIQPERNEGRGPWKASLRILNGARNGDSDPSTCGYSERRSCA